jgi:hypothetical protein
LIWELRLKAVLMGSAGLIALHLAFWAALMTVYPNSPKIQAEIFWNKRVRKVLGCGYVDLLLRWSPYLRQRLFYPFTKRLVLDADPDDFDEGAYFPESHVTYEEQGVSKSVGSSKLFPRHEDTLFSKATPDLANRSSCAVL